MSMILNLRGTTDADIDALLAHPETIRSFLYPYEAEMAAAAKPPGFFARLFGKRAAMPVTPPPVYRVDGEPMEMDLDKAWHAIHFLLTGTDYEGDPPLNFLFGGKEIGDVDVGYGPARALRPAEVLAVKEALDGITSDELRKRFDPARMTEEGIYPDIWDRDPAEDDTLGYVITYYEDMKAFLDKVTSKNLGLLVFLN